MTRGVRNEGWSIDVYRQRTYRRLRGVEEYKLHFTYHEGGTYIDVKFRGEETAFEVINVWNYEEGKSSITTRKDVKAEVNEFMAALNADELRNYWLNHHGVPLNR